MSELGKLIGLLQQIQIEEELSDDVKVHCYDNSNQNSGYLSIGMVEYYDGSVEINLN